jgi:hypothetical protein
LNSPEWRSFASCEMAEIETDIHLAAHPVQDSSTNRLLGNADKGVYVGEGSGTSANFQRSYANVSPEYFDTTETPQVRRTESARCGPAKPSTSGTFKAERAHAPGYWKGNSFYALTWEDLGIVVSICFLGKLSGESRLSLNHDDLSIVLGAFVAHLKGQHRSDWSARVLQATRIALSLWPILFSGVLWNAIRAVAYWRVERGVDPLVQLTHLRSTYQR